MLCNVKFILCYKLLKVKFSLFKPDQFNAQVIHTKIKQTKPRIGPEQGKSPGSLNTAPGHKLNPTLCVEKHFRIFC